MSARSAEERGAYIVERLLGSQGHVSGEDLAERLGVSRTAVWNCVSGLKRLGLQIESQPHLGYRLAAEPDILLPAVVRHGLAAAVIGRRVVHLESASSTSDEAERLAREGEAEGTVVIAEGQTAGRGGWGGPGVPARKRDLPLHHPEAALVPSRASFLTLCGAVAAQRRSRRAPGSGPR